MNLRVVYCGGCNPFYDRVGLVRRILTDERVRELSGTAGPDALLAVSGCSRSCAKRIPALDGEVRIAVNDATDPETIIRTLVEMR